MCGIIGYFNHNESIQKTINSMKKISYRGIDACGIYFDDKIITAKNPKELQSLLPNSPIPQFSMGHLLHSIVDFIPQPIKRNGVFISNCEIYNWRELAKKYDLNVKNDSQMLLDLIEKKGIDNILEVLDLLDGSFSFAYLNENKLFLARDIIGIKPLWYYFEDRKLEFASEKKAINEKAIELDPRKVLIYDTQEKIISFVERKLKYTGELLKENFDEIKKKTKELLFDAIKKRIPQGQKVGVLFSGGIDSTFIAYVLKQLNVDFTCYTAKLTGGNIEEAEDYVYAKEISKKYGFKLKVVKITTNQLENYVRKIIPLIEDNEYLKVSVALPFYLACQRAKKDNIKVIFSGLGSEEIFAGYRRHRNVEDINLECYRGLTILHERDLYRDDVITMKNNIEIRIPFLDNKLIEYSLKIPAKYKYDPQTKRNKIILRDISKEIGIDEKYSERAKKAAQYGSKFDKGLLRLAKDANMGKQEYLEKLV